MLATSRAGYPTEVQLELVVVALAWGDVLMNTYMLEWKPHAERKAYMVH